MIERQSKNYNYHKRIKELYNFNTLSDYLPYESYDEGYGIYVNSSSCGFILESSVFVGSNDQIENELLGLFKHTLPEGSNIQFLLIASSKIDNILARWEEARIRNACYPIITDLASERRKYLNNKALNGLFRIRNFRVIISCSFSCRVMEEMELKKAQDLKKQVKTILAATGSEVIELKPEGLIRTLDEILNYDGTTVNSQKEWNQRQPIRDQILNPNTLREITEKSIILNQGEWEYRTYSANKYPREWFLGGMSKLIGDPLRDALKIPCQFIMHYGVHIVNSGAAKQMMLAKGKWLDNQSRLAKWIPGIFKEQQEWQFIWEQFDQNERLVKTHFQILLIDKPDSILNSESLLHTLYRSNGWELSLDNYINLPSLISMLPLAWGEGMQHDMGFFKKAKTTLSYEPINLLPIQAECKGTPTPGVPFVERRGQLYYWFPFDNDNGNFNISVCGRPGSGKSVLMQEIATSILGLNGSVFVLDVGRSFERPVKLFGGEFIEFSTKSNLCLNPFTTINDASEEDVADSLSILKPIISLMVAPKAGTTDAEDSIIERGLWSIWKTNGKDASIDELAKWLQKNKDPVAHNLGNMLYPYSKEGAYGKFFNGKGNVDFSNKYIVTELQELKERKDLQAVVLQNFMLLISNRIVLGKRQHYSGIVFDEAWDLLKGKQSGAFIEALARTLRKFRGSLIVGTQALNDFYSSPGAEAAFNNSDWLCMFSQKTESIEQLKRSGKFSIDEYTQNLLNSVKTKQGEYSEVMIMSPKGSVIGRLILDPFSRVLYSTKAEEFAAVKRLEESGLSLVEAIRNIAENRYGNN